MSRPGPSLKRSGYPELDRRLIGRAHPRLEREGVDRPDHVSAIAIILPKIRRREPRAADRKRSTIPPSSETGTGPRPTSMTRSAITASRSPTTCAAAMLDGVVLVPDGVAKITLRVIRIIKPPSDHPSKRIWHCDRAGSRQHRRVPTPDPDSRDGTPSEPVRHPSSRASNLVRHGRQRDKRTTTSLDVLVKVAGTEPSPAEEAATSEARGPKSRAVASIETHQSAARSKCDPSGCCVSPKR